MNNVIASEVNIDDNNTANNMFQVPTETLTVHGYDWKVRDKYGDDDHVAIHCWALDKESKPYLLRFADFPAFCYLELPMFVRNRKYQWRPGAIDEFMKQLSSRLGDDAPTRYTFKEAKKTYYYRGTRKYPMLQLCFNNLKAMQHCSNLVANPLKTDDWGFIKCNMWEDKISIVRKLLTVRNVRYSQWFTINAKKVDSELRVSSLENEYFVEWDTMTAVPNEECKSWTTQPGVLSFDIECYSDNFRAMPDKYNSKHVAYMISCIYQKYKQPKTRKRFGIIIGDCNHIPKEKLDQCEIIKVDTEYEMVEAFARVTQETDPEILVGYNILGFDYPYLDHRIKRVLKQWPVMGRMLGEKSVMTSKNWKSGAYGHQSINMLEMDGRISIDLLPIIKREHNRLPKFDLNTVCFNFLKKQKHDVKAPEMFMIYENMRTTLTALVAILREAQADPSLLRNAEHCMRVMQAQEAFDQAKIETTRVMEYCIQDSELVTELMEHLNIWASLVEMSNIVGTTIVELFTRGQQVRCVSQLYDLAARKGFVLDARDSPGFAFTGGAVYEPKPGLYDNVICLDFSSLYPSIMQAYNICYTTLVPPELEDQVPDEDCHIIEFDQEEDYTATGDEEDEDEFLEEIGKKSKKNTRKVTKHYRFKFYKKQEGLLPCLVRQLVAERRAVNRLIAQIKDEIKADEKIEEVRSALTQYLNGTIEVHTVEEATRRVKELSEVKPSPPPEVIGAAKRSLGIAQLFDVNAARKRLESARTSVPPTHPKVIDEAALEVTVSELLAAGVRDDIVAKLEELNASSEERKQRISSNKLTVIVLDKRQLALKVSANSFFGFLGVHNGGKMPLIEGAMSITAKGRDLIGTVRRYIEEKYGGIQIYGDTDSVMMVLPQIKDSKECTYWGIRLSQEISGIKPGEKDCDGVFWPEGRPGLFPAPLGMEFEKAMLLLCFKKKKYAALLIGKDGNYKVEEISDKFGNVVGTKLMMLLKGIVLARRDNCKFLRETYMAILELIMKKKGLDEAITVLVDAIQRLLDGKVPYQDLSIIRELGANYKSDSYFMKVFSEELKKAGKIVNPGDRLDFVIVEDPTATLLGHKMRLVEQYTEKLNTPTPDKIDYMYYIEKALMNPINQLFAVGFKNEIAQLQHISYRPTNRHKNIYLDKPMQIILKLRERGYDLNVFKDAVIHNVAKLKEAPPPITLNVIQPQAPQPVVVAVPQVPQPVVVAVPQVPQPVVVAVPQVRPVTLSLNVVPKPLTLPVIPQHIPQPTATSPTLVIPRVGTKQPTSPPTMKGMPVIPTIVMKINKPQGSN